MEDEVTVNEIVGANKSTLPRYIKSARELTELPQQHKIGLWRRHWLLDGCGGESLR